MVHPPSSILHPSLPSSTHCYCDAAIEGDGLLFSLFARFLVFRVSLSLVSLLCLCLSPCASLTFPVIGYSDLQVAILLTRVCVFTTSDSLTWIFFSMSVSLSLSLSLSLCALAARLSDRDSSGDSCDLLSHSMILSFSLLLSRIHILVLILYSALFCVCSYPFPSFCLSTESVVPLCTLIYFRIHF